MFPIAFEHNIIMLLPPHCTPVVRTSVLLLESIDFSLRQKSSGIGAFQPKVSLFMRLASLAKTRW